jgi:hypothetical protein
MKLRRIVLALAIGLACAAPSSALPNMTGAAAGPAAGADAPDSTATLGSRAADSSARAAAPKRTHFPWGAIVVPELLVFLLIVGAVRRSKRG